MKNAALLVLLASFLFPLRPAFGQNEDPNHWVTAGNHDLAEARALKPNRRRARNVILFVGDGMGVSTLTAARIFDGQQHGHPGEENVLSYETLPYVALSKTYNTNQQVADSAGTMSAMMTGYKTLAGVISVNSNVRRADCGTTKAATVPTFLEQAESVGMATGVISTARITHATPAATYAHAPERNWESDGNMQPEDLEAGCKDIALQLLENDEGDGIELAWGGGRRSFLPDDVDDPEHEGTKGARRDGRDLTQEWVKRFGQGSYVWNREQFEKIPATANHVLALFEPSHMKYEHDRKDDTGGEPSLSEMTDKAIDILSQRGGKDGYFLMVEAGRIDHGHHAGNAYRALSDTVELSKAVQVALKKTSAKDTLIIVTADHSHTLTIAGYPKRGNPILGKVVSTDEHGEPEDAPYLDAFGLPYTTLNYANGPGYVGTTDAQPEGPKHHPHYASRPTAGTHRPDLSQVDTTDADYLQETHIFAPSETHGGEDVAIFARGPGAYLFHGVHEQSYIYHVMKYATRMEKRLHKRETSGR